MSWHNGSTATCTCDQCEDMRAAIAAYDRDEREAAQRDEDER